MPSSRSRLTACGAWSSVALTAAALLSGCGVAGSPAAVHGRIIAVGAENQYANVISQIAPPMPATTRPRRSHRAKPTYAPVA